MQTESFLLSERHRSSFGGSENMFPNPFRSFSNEYCDDDYKEAWFSFLLRVLDLVSLSKNSSDEKVTSKEMESFCFRIIIGQLSCNVSIEILEKEAFRSCICPSVKIVLLFLFVPWVIEGGLLANLLNLTIISQASTRYFRRDSYDGLELQSSLLTSVMNLFITCLNMF